MVCAACEAKLGRVACPEVRRGGEGGGRAREGGGGRGAALGENKLLAGKRKWQQDGTRGGCKVCWAAAPPPQFPHPPTLLLCPTLLPPPTPLPIPVLASCGPGLSCGEKLLLWEADQERLHHPLPSVALPAAGVRPVTPPGGYLLSAVRVLNGGVLHVRDQGAGHLRLPHV